MSIQTASIEIQTRGDTDILDITGEAAGQLYGGGDEGQGDRPVKGRQPDTALVDRILADERGEGRGNNQQAETDVQFLPWGTFPERNGQKGEQAKEAEVKTILPQGR